MSSVELLAYASQARVAVSPNIRLHEAWEELQSARKENGPLANCVAFTSGSNATKDHARWTNEAFVDTIARAARGVVAGGRMDWKC